MPLTDLQCRKAKANSKLVKFSDMGGLQLWVYARGEHWYERVKMMTWWADYLDQLRKVGQVVSMERKSAYTKLHRGRHPQRLMHAAEIVMHDVQRDGSAVVEVVLGEGVCQPREAALLHSQRQILSLDI